MMKKTSRNLGQNIPAKNILDKPKRVTLGFAPWIKEKNKDETNRETYGLKDSNKFFKTYPLKIISSKTETPIKSTIDNKTLFKLKSILTKTISLINNKKK